MTLTKKILNQIKRKEWFHFNFGEFENKQSSMVINTTDDNGEPLHLTLSILLKTTGHVSHSIPYDDSSVNKSIGAIQYFSKSHSGGGICRDETWVADNLGQEVLDEILKCYELHTKHTPEEFLAASAYRNGRNDRSWANRDNDGPMYA